MRRRNFMVALLTAAITMGSMFAIFGKDNFNHGSTCSQEKCDHKINCTSDEQKK